MANYALAFPVIFMAMAVTQMEFTPWLAYLPVIIPVQATFLTGMVLILSAIHIYFRDTTVLVNAGLTAWFFMTPIAYRVEDVRSDMVAW